MGVRIGGMISGMDTDSIVKGLSSAYQVKIDKKNKSKKKLEYQQDAWKTLNEKLTKLYKGTLSKMKTYGNYKTKKATVANSNGTDGGVKITASTSATNGSYKLKVNSAASAAFITGASLSSQKYTASYNAANATTFDKMHVKGGTETLADQLNGQKLTFRYDQTVTEKDADGNDVETTKKGTFEYEFNDASSVADINNKLKEAGITGLSASMKDGKISFSNTAGFTKKEDGSLDTAKATYSISGSALTTLGYDSSSVSVNVEQSQDAEGKYTFNTSASANTAFQYDTADTKLTGKTVASQYLSDAFAASSNVEDGKKYVSFNLAMGDGSKKEVKIYEDQTMDDVAKAIQTASGGKVNASFDATNQRFFLTSTETGAENDFKLEATDDNSKNVLMELGLHAESRFNTGKGAMSVQSATDAEIELNGAILTSKSNKIDAAGLGLTIDVGAAKIGEDLSVDVSADTDGVYNMIKDFFKEYNSLLADMTGAYNAEKSEYEPLTEEEEAAMTETQIQKWEDKVKADVLRRDDRLDTIINTMRNSLTSAVSITNPDGSTSKLSLASFGVTTGKWNEYGVIHIAGDEDDADYSDKTNKLKKALAEDPDKVMNTFGKVFSDLYGKLDKMMRSSTQRTYGNIYNDKTMKKQKEDYDKDITALQEKLEKTQDKYYKQFSKMEVALSKVNAVASQLGFGTTTGQQ